MSWNGGSVVARCAFGCGEPGAAQQDSAVAALAAVCGAQADSREFSVVVSCGARAGGISTGGFGFADRERGVRNTWRAVQSASGDKLFNADAIVTPSGTGRLALTIVGKFLRSIPSAGAQAEHHRATETIVRVGRLEFAFGHPRGSRSVPPITCRCSMPDVVDVRARNSACSSTAATCCGADHECHRHELYDYVQRNISRAPACWRGYLPRPVAANRASATLP